MCGEFPAFLRAIVKIFREYARRPVLRRSKLHPSSSALTTVARPCTTDASKKPPARVPYPKTNTENGFSVSLTRARAYAVRSLLYIFRSVRENDRKSQVVAVLRFGSSRRSIVSFGIRSSDSTDSRSCRRTWGRAESAPQRRIPSFLFSFYSSFFLFNLRSEKQSRTHPMLFFA